MEDIDTKKKFMNAIIYGYAGARENLVDNRVIKATGKNLGLADEVNSLQIVNDDLYFLQEFDNFDIRIFKLNEETNVFSKFE